MTVTEARSFRGPTRARGVRRVAGKMNGTEAAFDEYLAELERRGEVLWRGFERVTFKLADDVRLTPDFMTIDSEGFITFWEVKGFFRDDARVKLKVAAERFPHFQFMLVRKRAKKDGGGWDISEIDP